jgi:succinate dehydrogenase flavin-adding protein (antitoxin of CptAB toxin-antitoxin module)
MEEILMKMIQEKVWVIIRAEFQDYIEAHFDRLSSNEQTSFAKLLVANDEYTKQILDGLWDEFSITACTDERMRELFLKEMQELGMEIKN